MKSCRNTLIILILFNCLLFGQERTDLWSISIALMDSTGKLSIDEVLALPESDFSTPGGGAKRINKRSPTYLRFNLPELTTGRRYLHLEPHTVDSIILFQNSRPIRLSGGNVKMNDRSTKTSRYGYVLPNEAGHYLLKLTDCIHNYKSSHSRPISIFILNSTSAWEASQELNASKNQLKANKELWFLTFVFAVFFLVFISWIITKESTFGHYSLYVCAIFFYYLFRRSYLFYTDVFYITTETRLSFEITWIPIILLTYSLFVKTFLEIRLDTRLPRIIQALNLARNLALGALATSIILLLLFDIYWGARFSIFVQLCYAPITAYLAYLLFSNKNRFSYIIASGMMLLIIGAILVLINNWLKPNYNIDLEPPPFGFFQYAILAELFLYWLGLMYNWYDLRIESELNQKKLKELQTEIDLHEENMAQTQLTITTPRMQYKWERSHVQGFMADREISHCLLADGEVIAVPLRLGQLEEQLPEGFIRVQRSYIVNKDLIVRVENGRKMRLRLSKWPTPIPVGNSFRENVKMAMDAL